MDHVGSFNDAALKPKLLQSLIRDRLPDESHPLPDPSHLSLLLSYLETHSLLAESAGKKVGGDWKDAVDAWVDRVLRMASSVEPDKRWAGVSLLGFTCEKCHVSRFVQSYSCWFQKLLANIEQLSEPNFIKAAACASLSDLLTRLAGFSNMRKDATTLATKVVKPILHMLTEGANDTVWLGALDVLCTCIIYFPASVNRNYENVEASLVSKIMSGKCCLPLSKRLSRCLALLPKARGDKDSCTLMMQKILIAISTQLDDAFEGLNQGFESSQMMDLLVPPGSEPSPLGGHMTLKEDSVTKRFQELLVPRFSTLVRCLCIMLTNSYPVQISVPIRPLIGVVEQVLSVDGSVPVSFLFTTALRQELVCSELPALHMSSLDLLAAIIKGSGSQLLPYGAKVVRFLVKYFKEAALPCIRSKVYSIIEILLFSMGAGISEYLAVELVNNASVDLNCFSRGNKGISAVDKESGNQNNPKKRKHVSELVSDQENAVEKSVVPVPVQLAALGALEALLTMGGSMRSESWRSDVDFLLITVATKVLDAFYSERCFSAVDERATSCADLLIPALQALLASLLSSGVVRPPYLSQGLELFRRGRRETGTSLAAFCAHALLALEVLIHPRSLPLDDFQVRMGSAYGGFENKFSKFGQPAWNNMGISNNFGVDDDDNDDDSWLDNGEENETDNNEAVHMETIEPLVVSQAEVVSPPIARANVKPPAAPKPNNIIETMDICTDLIHKADLSENDCEANARYEAGNAIISMGENVIAPAVTNPENVTAIENDSLSLREKTSLALNPGHDANLLNENASALSRGKRPVYDSDSSLDSLPPIEIGDSDIKSGSDSDKDN